MASPQNRDILAEIKQTGILKVAMRTDAPPFGYVKDRDWTGYCADLAVALGDRLTQELNPATAIEVFRQPSHLSNRFDLIKQETVHLECGPNSIVGDREGVVFSDPFFSSGTGFLVDKDNSNNLDLNSQLEGTRLGVLGKTTTQEFLLQNYPDAEIVTFDSANGKKKGIQALDSGELDAMVSDRVLLSGEIDRQGLDRDQYQTIPEHPLTCDYYGLILPKGDPKWRNLVSTFIRDRAAKQRDRWLNEYYQNAIADLDYCQNQHKHK